MRLQPGNQLVCTQKSRFGLAGDVTHTPAQHSRFGVILKEDQQEGLALPRGTHAARVADGTDGGLTGKNR